MHSFQKISKKQLNFYIDGMEKQLAKLVQMLQSEKQCKTQSAKQARSQTNEEDVYLKKRSKQSNKY